MLFGALGGLLHAVATVTFGVDHVVSGVAINILAPGIVRFLSELLYTDNPAGGGVTQSPALTARPAVAVASRCSRRARTCSATSRASTGSWSATSPGCSRGDARLGVLTILAVLLIPGRLPAAVADVVRPAAALVRGEPVGRRLPRRAGLPDEVHRA